MTITISEDLESKLRGEASRHGVDADEYARRLIERGLRGSESAESIRASLEVLDKWEQETATTDPSERARREQEFEDFKEAMNRNRLDSEGPDARKIYP